MLVLASVVMFFLGFVLMVKGPESIGWFLIAASPGAFVVGIGWFVYGRLLEH